MRDGMQEMSRDERRAMRADMRERRGEGQAHDFMERLERPQRGWGRAPMPP